MRIIAPGSELRVFVGGCSLEAVKDVCHGDLDSIGSLVDKSLIRAERGRFRMLETIREHAGELLESTGEAHGVRRAHAAFFVRLAGEAAADQTAAASDKRRTTLEIEHDNLRLALRFALDGGESVAALGLCAALWRFWFERGYLSEGRFRLDKALAASSVPSVTRCRALSGNGILAHYQGDLDRSTSVPWRSATGWTR